jgi:Zn-dependent protease
MLDAMFGRAFTLFRLCGFPIRIHPSWLVLATVLATVEAGALQEDPGFDARTSWLVAIAVVVGLFVSLVLHELMHSLVARRTGMKVRAITMFLLGGVSEMEDEPETAWREFAMAIVGPLASLVIALGLFAAWWWGDRAAWPAPLLAAVLRLATCNAVLAVFNLVPAYPLDGGRVLRAMLWGLRGDALWATRIAAAMGVGFGVVLIVGGIALSIAERTPVFLLHCAVGVFLVFAARLGLRHAAVRRALHGTTVRTFVQASGVVGVPRWIPLTELVTDHLVARRERLVPVTDGERLLGCVSREDVERVPREAWASTPVGEVMRPCARDIAIGLDAPAEEALARMTRERLSHLLVLDQGRLAGVVLLRDIAAFMSVR